jgi:5-methylthioadenosine/S-adenosylhomocysteine deaminase
VHATVADDKPGARTAGRAPIYSVQLFCALLSMVNPQPADLLIEPRWLLPMSAGGATREHAAVAVGAGSILAVGEAAELRTRFAARTRIVRPRHALIPGLVNAHTRACHALLRGMRVRGPRTRWLSEILGPIERRSLGADFVRDGTRSAIADMLRAGITCFADFSPLPEEAARTAAAAQMRARIALPVADIPTAWAEDAGGHLARAERLWDEYRSDPRIGLYFAPLAAHTCDSTLTRVRRVADELEARVAMHLGEFPRAYGTQATEATGGYAIADAPHAARPLEQLHALGLLRPGFCAIGAADCDEPGRELLQRTGGSLIACPQAEMRLGGTLTGGVPLLPGARTALGTDSPALSGAFDLLAEARSAGLLSQLSGMQALELATLGGATALGLAADIGSIEPGKAADLTCLDLSELGCHCGTDIAAAIVFGATRAQVSDVWTAGRAQLSEGQLLCFDAAELAQLPAQWAQRLALDVAA